MKIEISNVIKGYLEKTGFELGRNSIKHRQRLIAEAVCYTVYAVASIIVICVNKAEITVMWLNLICLLQVIIHMLVHASEMTGKLRSLDMKRWIFNFYQIKAIVIVAVFLAFGMAFVIAYVSSYASGQTAAVDNNIKWISSVAIFIMLLNNYEELAIYGYDASIVKG